MRKLILAQVKRRKHCGWTVEADGAETIVGFTTGSAALKWAIAEGYQVGYRGMTYNDGGYLHGVKADNV